MLHTNFLFRSIFFLGGGGKNLLPTGVKILNPPLVIVEKHERNSSFITRFNSFPKSNRPTISIRLSKNLAKSGRFTPLAFNFSCGMNQV